MRKKGRERDGEMAGERAGESMGGGMEGPILKRSCAKHDGTKNHRQKWSLTGVLTAFFTIVFRAS